MALRKGSVARLVPPETVQGEILDVKWNADTDSKEMLIQWTGHDDSVNERWFPEAALEEVLP
jgi:hypothetical protein